MDLSDAFYFSIEACCLCAPEPPDSCETMVTPVQISLRCPAGEAAHSALATGLSAPPLRGNQIIAQYWRRLLSGEVGKALGFSSREPEAFNRFCLLVTAPDILPYKLSINFTVA